MEYVRLLWPHMLLLIALLLLFAAAGGGFSASAKWISQRAGGVNQYLADPEAVRMALLVLCVANLLGAVITLQNHRDDTVREGYLIRENYGGLSETEELFVTVDGVRRPVTVEVEPRALSEPEINEALYRAAQEARTACLAGADPDHVDRDLNFVKSIGDPAVSLSWMTDHPELLDWDGHITEAVPEEGVDVTVSALLALSGRSLEISLPLRVFPPVLTEEERFHRDVELSLREKGSEEEDRLLLPESIAGQPAVWARPSDPVGYAMVILGAAAAVALLLAGPEKEKERERKRREALAAAYPEMALRLVLLLQAGLGVRASFSRMAAEERKRRESEMDRAGRGALLRRRRTTGDAAGEKTQGEKARGDKAALSFPELVVRQLEAGVPEREVYERIAEESPDVHYRTFASLLLSHLTRGGPDALRALKAEAISAQEERRRRALVLGEQASTRLLFPMMLMLAVVMVILVVPALTAF